MGYEEVEMVEKGNSSLEKTSGLEEPPTLFPGVLKCYLMLNMKTGYNSETVSQ